MRILLVAHRYPPRNHAGVEVYTAGLARALRSAGHTVAVFCAEKDIALPDGVLRRRQHEGVEVHEWINNLIHDDPRESFDLPRAEEAFDAVLASWRPEVVHFLHLLYLSLGLPRRARERGIPSIYTMHDFWLQCARFGQRLRADGELCRSFDEDTCARCLVGFPFAQPPLERRIAPLVAGIRRWTGWNLAGPLRRAAARMRPRSRPQAATAQDPDPAVLSALAGFVRAREEAVRRDLAREVYAFVAPSRFLEQEFLRWGLAREKVRFHRSGIDVSTAGLPRAPRAELLRVAFLGTIVPHKGLHVLLDAWSRRAVEGGLRLRIHGNERYRPDYVEAMRARARELGAEWCGELAHERVPAVLAETDLLVVPSVWFENSPLVIQEALAAATPLLVSDLGGMRELVEPDVHGWRFAPGDAGALAERLDAVGREPALLEGLYPGGPVFPRTIVEDAADLVALYREALAARTAESGAS